MSDRDSASSNGENSSTRDSENELSSSSESSESSSESSDDSNESVESTLVSNEDRLILKSVDELKPFEDEDDEENEKFFLLIDSYCIDTITVPGGHKRDMYYPKQNLFDLSQVEDFKCKFFNYKHLDAASRTFHDFYDKERFELYLNFGNITCEISRKHNKSWIDVSIENKGTKTFASLHHDASQQLKLLSKNFLASKKKKKKELSEKHKAAVKQLKNAKGGKKKDDIKRFGQQIHSLEEEKFKLKGEISSLETGGTGWKIHISVDDTDTASMLNAWNILLYCSIKHGMPSFKVKSNYSPIFA